jgi:hypothetical protein
MLQFILSTKFRKVFLQKKHYYSFYHNNNFNLSQYQIFEFDYSTKIDYTSIFDKSSRLYHKLMKTIHAEALSFLCESINKKVVVV